MDQLPVLTETRLLKPVATIIVPARTEPFDMGAFYRNSTGFYVADTLVRRMGAKRKKLVSTSECSYVALLLKELAYDTDILKELPKEASLLTTFEGFAVLFDAQRNGQLALFLDNGRANNIYLQDKGGKTFVIRARASQDSNKFWFLHDWKLNDGGEWHVGDRIIFPGTAVF